MIDKARVHCPDWFLKYESAKLPSFVRIYIIAAI